MVDQFYDEAVSGANPVTDRKGFAEMLERLLSNGARHSGARRRRPDPVADARRAATARLRPDPRRNNPRGRAS
ncbi:MAG TPA: hypothetical protein VNY10_24260 [Roseiarcus sp.]|nr:hypothetical protein [Roseiarcus sp.]